MKASDLQKLKVLLKDSSLNGNRKKVIESKIDSFIKTLNSIHFDISKIANTLNTDSELYNALQVLISDGKLFSNQNVPKCDLAIICALKTELKPVLDLCENIEEINLKDSNYLFSIGNVKSQNGRNYSIVAAHANRMGFPDSAQLTSELIMRFRPSYLIMTGVCGGRKSKNVKIGDIILPKDIFAYQVGKLTDKGFENELAHVTMDDKIIQSSNKIEELASRRIFDLWPGKKDRALKIHNDSLASGSMVINQLNYVDREIARQDRKLVAVDMEAYAVMRTAKLFDKLNATPIIIKSVSDYTESKDELSDKAYASFTSALYMHALLDQLVVP